VECVQLACRRVIADVSSRQSEIAAHVQYDGVRYYLMTSLICKLKTTVLHHMHQLRMTRSISGNMDSRAHVLFLPGSNPLLLFFHHLHYTCRATASDDLVMNTLHEIDARILVLETELTELRARRNTFAPLCQLPVELIVRILKTVQRPANSPDANILQLNWEPSNLQWCRFTAVCRYIRTVALEETELWSFIDLQDYSDKSVSAGLRWLDICIERAGMHDLVVRNASPNLKINLHARDLEYWSRAYVAVLHPKEQRNSALKRSPARLQVLSYHGSLRIDHTVLDHGRCSLQSLSVSTGHLVSSIQAPTLRKLSIQNTHLRHSWDPLWDFLEANSQLEVLELSNIRIQDPSNDCEDLLLAKSGEMHIPRISMPSLRVLKSCNIPRSSIRLLQALPDPSKELYIEVPDDGHDSVWYIGSDNEHTRERSGHQKLFDILKNKSARDAPSGDFLSEGDPNYVHHHHHLRFRSWSANGAAISFSTRCVLMGPHPALEYVYHIYLRKVDLYTWMSESSAGHLNKISRLSVLKCLGNGYSWKLFEIWLRSRIEEGWPLRLVDYESSDYYAKESVARLVDTGVQSYLSDFGTWRRFGILFKERT
jgi:hypothetical protein